MPTLAEDRKAYFSACERAIRLAKKHFMPYYVFREGECDYVVCWQEDFMDWFFQGQDPLFCTED